MLLQVNGRTVSFTMLPVVERDLGTIEFNTTHVTLKADIGLTVVYSKYNVTTSLSPWYVNKTCGKSTMSLACPHEPCSNAYPKRPKVVQLLLPW